MFSELPLGSVFVVTEHGEQRLWRVVARCTTYPPEHRYYQPQEVTGDKAYTGVRRPILPGETIYRCVWKSGSSLETRRAYIVKSGDVTWESTGIKSSVPPHEEVWHNVLHKKI
jgi:hypothetical protein